MRAAAAYSCSNTGGLMANKNNTNKKNDLSKYEEKRQRLNTGAKIMAIIVSLAMIVTAFLSAGVFFLR